MLGGNTESEEESLGNQELKTSKRGEKRINSASTDSVVISKNNCLRAEVRTPEMQVENITKKSGQLSQSYGQEI